MSGGRQGHTHRYNDADVARATDTSPSYSEILRKLGANPASGGNHKWIRQRIKRLGLDTSRRDTCEAVPRSKLGF